MGNDTSLIVHAPIHGIPVQPSDTKMGEIPPAMKRGGEIVGSLAVGALGGYIFYWITRLIAKLGMLEGVGVINPLPYVLSGVISAAIVETARLTQDCALCVLGDRDTYENLAHPEDASAFDRLRQRTWKVVTRLEKVQHDVDVVFSSLFGIRSAKEIRDNHIPDQDLYFMEITRRAFWEQVHETISTSVPQELGIYLVEAMGYTLIGGHLFIWLHGVVFLSGLMDKVGKVYQKIDKEEIAEMNKRKLEFETKVTCDLLAGLYPDEFAQLDADEKGDTKIHDVKAASVQEPEIEEDIYDESDDVIVDEEGKKVQLSDFDPTQHKDLLAYRHTVCQSTYPIEGFEVNEDEDSETEDKEILEISEDQIPQNFVLAEIG